MEIVYKVTIGSKRPIYYSSKKMLMAYGIPKIKKCLIHGCPYRIEALVGNLEDKTSLFAGYIQ